MTSMQRPEFVESMIVLSNARKEMLAAAVQNARKALEVREQADWKPYVETPAEQRARARAERLAWVIDGLRA